ncbi:MAG: phosphoenolpyruvate carboxykinase (GTP), partial [Candidatus Omnitrophota bacterium]
MDCLELLKNKADKENFQKLIALQNPSVYEFIAEFVKLVNPKSIFVRTDSPKDIEYIRKRATELGEERVLATSGHTFHFDGCFDQARDKKNTKYLIPAGQYYGHYLNSIERKKGLDEIRGYLKDIMGDKEMFVCFFCLGPLDSAFSILAVQLTDSSYVAHSEDILYRGAYEQMVKSKSKDFFRFVHSAGQLHKGVSKNIEQRRVYIDLEKETVYSTNTQYAGNTVGLKKLALRLAIRKASQEGWLAEHMFIMGVHNRKGQKAYLCGAYPSMCGKTSTALTPGESVIGDDIAYLRKNQGKVFAVNVERGVFGIIKDVNSKDDPIIWNGLTQKGEVIFSNVLIDEKGIPFWIGKDKRMPPRGINFAGEWYPGKTDKEGCEIPPSHKNARYTVRLSALDNVDEHLEEPSGAEVKGI